MLVFVLAGSGTYSMRKRSHWFAFSPQFQTSFCCSWFGLLFLLQVSSKKMHSYGVENSNIPLLTTKIFNNLHFILIFLGQGLNIGQSAFNAIASIVNRLTVSSKKLIYKSLFSKLVGNLSHILLIYLFKSPIF